ncbi:uncharacterized protein [Antedon mediterranea]|uniref:uncharacterized protein n=1 Tax=Antedon mediterranea TaxID=105859 RepID=UPI003AF74868
MTQSISSYSRIYRMYDLRSGISTNKTLQRPNTPRVEPVPGHSPPTAKGHSAISTHFSKLKLCVLNARSTQRKAKPQEKEWSKYLEMQHISEPTHCSGHCLDLIITRDDLLLSDVKIHPGLSDHFAMFCKFDLKRPTTHKTVRKSRNLKQIDIEKFTNDIKACVSNITDVSVILEDSVESYSDIRAVLDLHAPVQNKTIKQKEAKPWYTDEIRSERKVRRQLERKWMKSKLLKDRQEYCVQRCVVNGLIEKAKMRYYSSLVSDCTGDQKKLFNIVNKLLHHSKSSVLPSSVSDEALAERFSVFFFLGKIIEKVVSKRILSHVQKHGLLDPYQSAYKAHHSTETALLRVNNDILRGMDDGKLTDLVLLYLSAAFDTVDHSVLLNRLSTYIGIEGNALDWCRSYSEKRPQHVCIGDAISKASFLNFSVPQGSVHGPQWFTIYLHPIRDIISKYDLCYHVYADDTQDLYFF